MPDDEIGPVVAKQIDQALKALGLSPENVATLLDIPPEKLKESLMEWGLGISQPPLSQLEKLAQLLNRSIDYFLSPTPPFPAEISFRSSVKQKEIRDFALLARRVIVEVEELCRAYKELEVLLNRPRKVEVAPYSKELGSEELAMKVRQNLGLGYHPVGDLHATIRRQGVLIFELEIPEGAFSGFSWWHEEYGPTILLNIDDFLPRRRFTLAHEYAHLLWREGTMVCGHRLDHFATLDTIEERRAFKFAASFLIPAYDLLKQFEQKEYKRPPDEKQIGALARRYNVSLQALAIRLEELKLAHSGFAEEFMDGVIQTKGERFPWFYRRPKFARAPWEQKFGKEYVRLALDAHKKELISIGRLAYYLRTDVKTAMDAVKVSERR